MKCGKHVFVAMIVLGLASTAQANMGTPLMWAESLHLMFGNLFIGLFEGLLLILVFKAKKLRALGLMVLANYLTAWLGWTIVRGLIVPALPLDLHNWWLFFWVMVGVTYILTLVFEFPFVALAFWRDPKWKRKAIIASLLVQTISYACLFGWYSLASKATLFTEAEVVPLSAMTLPQNIVFQYASHRGGDVYECSLSDPTPRAVEKDLPDRMEGPWEVTKIGAAQSSSWEFERGDYPMSGFSGHNEVTGDDVSFVLETPFVTWWVREAIHLPTDKVLFQLGRDQICIYDPETRQIALVVKGWGPIVVTEESE